MEPTPKSPPLLPHFHAHRHRKSRFPRQLDQHFPVFQPHDFSTHRPSIVAELGPAGSPAISTTGRTNNPLRGESVNSILGPVAMN
jgi:hypothetical protein